MIAPRAPYEKHVNHQVRPTDITQSPKPTPTAIYDRSRRPGQSTREMMEAYQAPTRDSPNPPGHAESPQDLRESQHEAQFDGNDIC